MRYTILKKTSSKLSEQSIVEKAVRFAQVLSRTKRGSHATSSAAPERRGRARWCPCASATASASPPCFGFPSPPPSPPWRRPSPAANHFTPAASLRVTPQPPPSLLRPPPPTSSPRSHCPLLSLFPASPAGPAPKRFRAMTTDAAAAPPASAGCSAMKAEFARHAEYLNALVSTPCGRPLRPFLGSAPSLDQAAA